MTTEGGALILRYLQDLEGELRDLPANRRQELRDESASTSPPPGPSSTPRSRLWTTRDKLIGTIGGLSWVVAGLGTVMTESLNLPAAQPGSDSPVGTPPPEPTGASPIEVFLFVVPFVLAIVAAIYLGFRLRRRTV